jgi:hypothetical protein
MKYIGSVMILCACIFISYIYESKEKERLECLKQMHSFISYIQVKIDYFLTPHKKLISEYDSTLIQNLYKNNFENLDKYFDKEIKTLLKNFFSSLGHGLKDEEIKLCEYTLLKLDEKISLLENEIGNKVKVARTLTIFGGSCFILLII